MPHVEISRHIEAPPEQVWGFISDIRRGPEWVTVMEDVLEASDGPMRQGTYYRERSKVGPSRSETEWRVTDFEPPRRQVHESHSATMDAVLTMEVVPEGEGARLIHRTEYRMLPVFRPLGWLVEKAFAERTMQREMEQTVENARRILEGKQR